MTTFTLPELGFGAAGLGNLGREVADEDAWALLEAVWESGVRHFDTAPHYGLGLSERRLGEFLRSRPREEFVLSTKVGRLLRPRPGGEVAADDEGFAVSSHLTRQWAMDADGVRRSLEESLVRLGLDCVDVLYLHDPERSGRADEAIGEGLPELARMRDEGLVRAVGVASMANESLARAATSGAADVLMVAGRYTLADPGAAEQVLPECVRNGVRVVSAAVFSSGLMAGTPSEGSWFDYAPVQPAMLRRAQRIHVLCRSLDVPLAAAALQFPLRHAAVEAVVVGGSTAEHARQNAALVARAVPTELWDRLQAEGLLPAG